MPRPNTDDAREPTPASIRLPAGNLPPELVIEPVLEPRTVFRVTFATSPHDRITLLRSLSSNRELGQKPRKIERVYSVLHRRGEIHCKRHDIRNLQLSRKPDRLVRVA